MKWIQIKVWGMQETKTWDACVYKTSESHFETWRFLEAHNLPFRRMAIVDLQASLYEQVDKNEI